VEQRRHSEEEAGEEPADTNDSGLVHDAALLSELRLARENIAGTLLRDDQPKLSLSWSPYGRASIPT